MTTYAISGPPPKWNAVNYCKLKVDGAVVFKRAPHTQIYEYVYERIQPEDVFVDMSGRRATGQDFINMHNYCQKMLDVRGKTHMPYILRGNNLEPYMKPFKVPAVGR